MLDVVCPIVFGTPNREAILPPAVPAREAPYQPVESFWGRDPTRVFILMISTCRKEARTGDTGVVLDIRSTAQKLCVPPSNEEYAPIGHPIGA